MQQTPPPVCELPTPLATLAELRAPLEWMSTLAFWPTLALSPRGDNRPVMLVPGYRASERSMWPLQRFLTHLGYDVYDWEQGQNKGQVNHYIEALGARTQALYKEVNQQPITLIGWSLGGVIAREVARLYATEVREVITMGTPIIGGPKYTLPGRRFAKRQGFDLDKFELEVHERNSIGLAQPVTSIYSKSDGIVGWKAAIDVYNPQARNIRVRGSHLGLGVNLKVWRIIARVLASGSNA